MATFVVNSTNELITRGCDSVCTLLDAVIAANESPGADSITFDPSIHGQQITLSTPLRVMDSVSIDGPGADRMQISGGGGSRIFTLGGPAAESYTVRGLTLSAARTAFGPGGAIQFGFSGIDTNEPDSLTVDQTIIAGGGAPSGGGIYAEGGQLTINRTSFVSNIVTGIDGVGSAIHRVGGNTLITNSTISGNSSLGPAVVIASEGEAATGQIVSSTFADNGHRAIHVVADTHDAFVELGTTVLAGNASGTLATSSSFRGTASIASVGHNLSDAAVSAFLNQSTDRTSINPRLADRNAQQVHVPLPGSPLIDSAASGGDIPAIDQLGNTRPQGAGVDIGAIEIAYDFGDAPGNDVTSFQQSYPTLAATGGAHHVVAGPRLGPVVDSERDGQPLGGSSIGDSSDDGVTFIGGTFQPLGSSITMVLDLQNPSSQGNFLDAWVDWNRNGSWLEPDEQFADSFGLGITGGTRIIDLPIPETVTADLCIFDFGSVPPAGLVPVGSLRTARSKII